ncbi:MAG: caspase family protein, partial [Pseudorhodoplanes sp.]
PVPASPPPAIAAPVIPQVPAEEQAICSNRASAPNSVISACSTVIASGALSGRTLAITYHQRALAYRQINDSDRAIADATESIRLDPSQAGYFLTRCLAHYSKQNYGPAIADASDAIRLDPKSVSAYVNRAALHALTDDYDRALADTDEALRLDASNAGAQNVRGYVFNRKGMFDRALAELHEVIRRSPTFAVAYKNRAISHEGRGELDLALSDFRKAIELGLRGSPAAEAEATEGIRRVERKLAESHPPAAETKVAADAPQTVTPPAAERSESNATATAVAPAQRRVALVLGNGKYRHSTPLNNPANDAGDIASALRKIGFEVVEGIDVDRRSMEDKVREFGRKLDGAKLALFYYAGHGLQVGGKNYLLPVDSKLERAGDLPFETIDVHQVLAQMETEQRVNLVFLDACRDNPLSRSLRRSLGARSSSVGTGLATIQSAIGTMISFATQPDAIALDGEGRNSPFTTGILKHLSTPGLDIAILMRRVRADVIADTGGKQVPWDHSSLIGEVVLAR